MNESLARGGRGNTKIQGTYINPNICLIWGHLFWSLVAITGFKIPHQKSPILQANVTAHQTFLRNIVLCTFSVQSSSEALDFSNRNCSFPKKELNFSNKSASSSAVESAITHYIMEEFPTGYLHTAIEWLGFEGHCGTMRWKKQHFLSIRVENIFQNAQVAAVTLYFFRVGPPPLLLWICNNAPSHMSPTRRPRPLSSFGIV